MKIFGSVIACFLLLHSTWSEEVRLINLDPSEAQQIIEQKDQSLRYAPKIESSVPAVRYLGNEPHNVLEDVYLANQYHGQDGVGGYLYGYSVPDIAKTEKKQAGGDLRGAYNYIAGNGQEIQVRYWDDGTGFHQEDNLPKVLPQQIDDTPEVKAAKEEHYRIWQEQADRNSRPIQSPYDASGNYAQGPLSPQGQRERQQQLVNQYQQQKQLYPNPGQSVHYQGEQPSQYLGQQSQSVSRYQPGNLIGGGSQSSALGGKPSGQFGGSQSSSSGSGLYGSFQPSGSGQITGSIEQFGSNSQSSGSVGSGQYGGVQPSGIGGKSGSSGQFEGSQSSSTGQFGGGQSSGQISGNFPGTGQYGGVQPSGIGEKPGSSGQFVGSQSSLSGQFGGGQSSGSGQISGNFPGSGQYGGAQPSGIGEKPGSSGQFVGSQSSLSGQFGGGQSGSGQISGNFPGSGQYGGVQPSKFGGSPGSSGQVGGGQSSGYGQFSGSFSGSGQYGGQSGGGQQAHSGQYSSGGKQGIGEYSGEGEDQGQWDEKQEEQQGPPKGFFYNFDYPVGIIVSKDGGPIQKREGSLRDIYATNKANFEKQLQQGYSGSGASSSGYLAV